MLIVSPPLGEVRMGVDGLIVKGRFETSIMQVVTASITRTKQLLESAMVGTVHA